MNGRPTVSVVTECEDGAGWVFRLMIRDGPSAQPLDLRLSWADYDRWSGGRASPEEVAAAVARAALDSPAREALPRSADAATLARRWPGFEDRLRDHLPR